MRNKSNWEKKNLRCKTVQHNGIVKDRSKTVYAIRWADNCICDFLGWFQYDEIKTDKELKQMIKEKYNRNLVVLTADEEWNWYGTNVEMTHIERLWMTHFVKENKEDKWIKII